MYKSLTKTYIIEKIFHSHFKKGIPPAFQSMKISSNNTMSLMPLSMSLFFKSGKNKK
jgi:hypothetical protein